MRDNLLPPIPSFIHICYLNVQNVQHLHVKNATDFNDRCIINSDKNQL